MGRPRISIAGLMLFTAILALHCLAARAAWGGEHDSLYAAVGLLMADVLTAGLGSLRRRKRAGKSGRFLDGFEVGGWSGLLLYAACCVLASGPMQVYQDSTSSIVSAVTGLERLGGMPSTVGAHVNLAALILTHSAILLMPQLVLALGVGLLGVRSTSPLRADLRPPDRWGFGMSYAPRPDPPRDVRHSTLVTPDRR